MKHKTTVRTAHSPDEYVHKWTLLNLPDAKNFYINDIDLTIRNRKGCLMIVEVKRKMAKPSTVQSFTYQMLDQCFQKSNGDTIKLKLPNTNKKVSFKLKYHGYHLLQFENTTFENGRVYFDNKEVTEKELIDILSFKFCLDC